jgi:hypothetical protein
LEMIVAKKRLIRRGWTDKDMRELSTLMRQDTSARAIARKLGRTEGAVRQKAFAEGLSFRKTAKKAKTAARKVTKAKTTKRPAKSRSKRAPSAGE